MNALTPAEIMTFRGLRKTAIVILLLIRLGGGPVTAKEIARILGMDYETIRIYLHDLSQSGVVTSSTDGWILLQDGSQLILPVDNFVENSAEFPRRPARIPRSSTTALSADNDLLHIAVEAEEAIDERGNSALKELVQFGITATPQVRDLVQKHEYITADYVRRHADRLNRERRFSTGLLLTVLRTGDPLPMTEDERRMESFRRFMR